MRILVILLLQLYLVIAQVSKPNIVFIVADDLGWNDVSFHGSSQIPTPNIDNLARKGIILDNYYVLPICSPTRSAILTGRYPIHTGMQTRTIKSETTWGVGVNETFLPQYLKRRGYKTHAIGKWHLGFYMKELTPTYRGFDSFYGYYSGKADYWDHSIKSVAFAGLDLHKDLQPVYTQWGNYSTEMYTAEAESRILTHNTSEPLFLYLAYQAVHSANTYDPLQAPKEWIDKFSHIKHPGRRVYAAMVAYMDYGIGRVYNALKEKGILSNTLIVFTTDNGGPPNGFGNNWANNYPLRGGKRYLYQGGVRGTGFIYSDILQDSGRISKDLFHVTDWLPTIVNLAGGKLPNTLDGVNQWDTLQNRKEPARNEILLNIDDKSLYNSALIRGDWKILIEGTDWNNWYTPPGVDQPQANLTVNCHGNIPTTNITNCKNDTKYGYCLFNLVDDPCEINDLSEKYPGIAQMMLGRLQTYRNTMVPPRYNTTVDPRSNPKLHNGVWVPWINE